MSELDGRSGLETSREHPLIKELSEIAKRHDLYGAVLVSFTRDMRVAICSTGRSDVFSGAMEQLGDRILARIDDGEFDPSPKIGA